MTNHTTTDSPDTTTSTDESEPAPERFDTLSGFQRDILRALYALDATHPQASETATSIREMLRTYPHYDTDEPTTSRFYPTTHRLQDRGWIKIQHDLEDARRRHYHLTTPAIQTLTTITAIELGHNTTTTAHDTTADATGGDGQ
ncbi:MarR family winged helix-turn-helix transcriptional regulator [Halorubellus sp. PRR65]|uniref:MarR family winged helix-turn-helix transcriptional regulator n=1 Tax=Halorubellus sp. PRR65 TaxID=3098148 RepID=UPI002B257234|nr:MarR family winged helix-turn-helix transcriptional regulator [Halorubellus sp. PRR65]